MDKDENKDKSKDLNKNKNNLQQIQNLKNLNLYLMRILKSESLKRMK